MGNKKTLITKAAFAIFCGVSKPAITGAIKKDLIFVENDKINPKHPRNVEYKKNAKLKAGNDARSIAAKKSENGKTKKLKTKDKSSMVPVTIGNVTIDVPLKEFGKKKGDDVEVPPDEYADIAARYMIARTSKIEQEDLKLKLQNARLRGELLDANVVYDGIFLYLDKLHSNLERMAGTFLNDIGYKIINAEEVSSDVKQEWVDGTLKQIDQAKKTIVKTLKTISQNQK